MAHRAVRRIRPPHHRRRVAWHPHGGKPHGGVARLGQKDADELGRSGEVGRHGVQLGVTPDERPAVPERDRSGAVRATAPDPGHYPLPRSFRRWGLPVTGSACCPSVGDRLAYPGLVAAVRRVIARRWRWRRLQHGQRPDLPGHPLVGLPLQEGGVHPHRAEPLMPPVGWSGWSGAWPAWRGRPLGVTGGRVRTATRGWPWRCVRCGASVAAVPGHRVVRPW